MVTKHVDADSLKRSIELHILREEKRIRMSSISFLSARAWLDDDGKHVWFSHECLDGIIASMLPFPTWKVIHKTKKVEPSFHCAKCGCHVVLELSNPDCPKCGATETELFKAPTSFALPEVSRGFVCVVCDHKWGVE